MRTADSLINRYFDGVEVSVSALEVGLGQLEEMYARTEAPIAVAETFSLTVPGGFETESSRSKTFTTAVPGTWLREKWDTHGSDLMSPNVRDYLGGRAIRAKQQQRNQDSAFDSPVNPTLPATTSRRE